MSAETPEFDTDDETLYEAWVHLANVPSDLSDYLVIEGEPGDYAGALTESERDRIREISGELSDLAYDIQDRQFGIDGDIGFGVTDADGAPDHVSTWAREHRVGPYADADDEGDSA